MDKFQLVTRSDFDGLVCAVLLNELNLIEDDIRFVHPKDMQDGLVRITNRDITTNLPYVAAAHLAFDHHASEITRTTGDNKNHIISASAPSAARVLYDYYGGKKAFPQITDEMMAAVDKADSAQFSRDEVLDPHGWVLLNFLVDPRTGLERVSEFRVGNAELMRELIVYCRHHDIAEALALPDVKERAAVYFSHAPQAREQILDCTKVYKKLAVLDLRNEDPIWATNRFMLYALFPQTNISIHVLWSLYRAKTVFATGKSIFDRSSKTHVGNLMLKYGGGGHEAAGTCQILNDQAESVLNELVEQINADG